MLPCLGLLFWRYHTHVNCRSIACYVFYTQFNLSTTFRTITRGRSDEALSSSGVRIAHIAVQITHTCSEKKLFETSSVSFRFRALILDLLCLPGNFSLLWGTPTLFPPVVVCAQAVQTYPAGQTNKRQCLRICSCFPLWSKNLCAV